MSIRKDLERFFDDRNINFCCGNCRQYAQRSLQLIFQRLVEVADVASVVCETWPDEPELAQLRASLEELAARPESRFALDCRECGRPR